MKVRILPPAVEDLAAGFYFYENESRGTGLHFLDTLEKEIDDLSFQAGIHPIYFDFTTLNIRIDFRLRSFTMCPRTRS